MEDKGTFLIQDWVPYQCECGFSLPTRNHCLDAEQATCGKCTKARPGCYRTCECNQDLIARNSGFTCLCSKENLFFPLDLGTLIAFEPDLIYQWPCIGCETLRNINEETCRKCNSLRQESWILLYCHYCRTLLWQNRTIASSSNNECLICDGQMSKVYYVESCNTSTGSSSSSSRSGSTSSSFSSNLSCYRESHAQWCFSSSPSIWQCDCGILHTLDLAVLQGDRKCPCGKRRPLFYYCPSNHVHSASTASMCKGMKTVYYHLDVALVTLVDSSKECKSEEFRHWYCFPCQMVVINPTVEDEFTVCSSCDSLMQQLLVKEIWSPEKKPQIPFPPLVRDLLLDEFQETISPKGANLSFWCLECGKLNDRNQPIQDCGDGRRRIKCSRCSAERQGKWECKNCTFHNTLVPALTHQSHKCQMCPENDGSTRTIVILYECSGLLMNVIEERYLSQFSRDLLENLSLREAKTLPAYAERNNLINPSLRRKQEAFLPSHNLTLSQVFGFFCLLIEENIYVDQVCLWQHLYPKLGEILALWEGSKQLRMPLTIGFWSLLSEKMHKYPEATYVIFLCLATSSFPYRIQYVLAGFFLPSSKKQHPLLTCMQACHLLS